jgi:hypothetical protein
VKTPTPTMSAMTIAVAANVVTLAPILLLKFGLVTCTPPATTPLLCVPKTSFYDDFGFGRRNSLFLRQNSLFC